jgi:hypothetical protein
MGTKGTWDQLDTALDGGSDGDVGMVINGSLEIFGLWERLTGGAKRLRGRLDLRPITVAAPEFAIGSDITALYGDDPAWVGGAAPGLQLDRESTIAVDVAGVFGGTEHTIWSVAALCQVKQDSAGVGSYFGAGWAFESDTLSEVGCLAQKLLGQWHRSRGSDDPTGPLDLSGPTTIDLRCNPLDTDWEPWVAACHGLALGDFSSGPIDALYGATRGVDLALARKFLSDQDSSADWDAQDKRIIVACSGAVDVVLQAIWVFSTGAQS